MMTFGLFTPPPPADQLVSRPSAPTYSALAPVAPAPLTSSGPMTPGCCGDSSSCLTSHPSGEQRRREPDPRPSHASIYESTLGIVLEGLVVEVEAEACNTSAEPSWRTCSARPSVT